MLKNKTRSPCFAYCCASLLLLAPAVSASTEFITPDALTDGRFIDWDYQDAPGQVCRANYQPPLFDPSFPVDETVINANEVFFPQNGTSILTGDVEVNEKNRRLFANQVYLYKNPQGEITRIEVPGPVLVEEPAWRLAGNDAFIVLENNQTALDEVQYRYYERNARGSASRVEYSSTHPTLLYQADYTTCMPDSRVWQLYSSKVRLNQESGRGEAFNSVLKVHDIPVFYTPYINFPIDDRRKSGFLMPDFGGSSNTGFMFITPYYFNLAPNYDATLYPRYMSDRGMQWGGDLRYLDEYHQTFFHGEFLNYDRAFAQFKDEEIAAPTYPDPNDPRLTGVTDASDDRWALAFKHVGQYDPNWSTFLDYNQVSDDNYYADLGMEIYSRNQRELLQRAQVDYDARNYSATAMVQNYQILQPFDNDLYVDPYQILPHLELDVMPDRSFLYSNVAANMQWTYFDHVEDPFTDERPTIGSRGHFNPTMQLPFRRSFGYVMPAVEYRYTQYDLALSTTDAMQENNDHINRSLPTFYVDSGVFFDRNSHFGTRQYTQTLEPRLFYLYTPYVNQQDIPLFDTDLYDFTTDQLFRTNRFNGLDRIGDANQVSAALTTRFYEHETGIERFKATVGQIYYFQDRKVLLCDVALDPYCIPAENLGADTPTSPVVGDLRYQFNHEWYSTMDGRYDPNPTDSNLYRLLFHYQPQAQKIVHFGFQYDESGNTVTGAEPGNSVAELLQSDIGMVWPIAHNWTLLGRWYYDIHNQFTVETFGGVEYENCCWGVRVGARRYLVGSNEVITEREYDSQVYLQFIFKGLTGIGSSPVSLLTSTIPGYSDRFAQNSL